MGRSWERAFNQYFNWYRKSENHEESQELADGEIITAMENNGDDIETIWEFYLDKEKVEIVIQNFGEKMRDIHEEVGLQSIRWIVTANAYMAKW